LSLLVPAATATAQSPGYLGIRFANVTNVLTRILGHDWRYGAKIVEIETDSPAATAGLKEGDIIVEADRRILGGADALRQFVVRHADQSRILGFVRDGDFHERRVQLGLGFSTAAPLNLAGLASHHRPARQVDSPI